MSSHSRTRGSEKEGFQRNAQSLVTQGLWRSPRHRMFLLLRVWPSACLPAPRAIFLHPSYRSGRKLSPHALHMYHWQQFQQWEHPRQNVIGTLIWFSGKGRRGKTKRTWLIISFASGIEQTWYLLPSLAVLKGLLYVFYRIIMYHGFLATGVIDNASN